MRIAGSCLLLVGLLLCATIDWAALGFFSMGIGLLCFLAAENKKKAISVQERNAPQPSIQPQPPNRKQLVARLEQSTISDKERWRRLCECDADLAEAEAILKRYGSKYASLLSSTYLLFENKVLLPNILHVILACYRSDVGFGSIDEAHPSTNPAPGEHAPPGITAAPRRPDREAELDQAPTAEDIVPPASDGPTTPDALQSESQAAVVTNATSSVEEESAQNLKHLLEKLNQPIARKQEL